MDRLGAQVRARASADGTKSSFLKAQFLSVKSEGEHPPGFGEAFRATSCPATLAIERHHARYVAGINAFRVDNWHSTYSLIRTALQITGLYGRGIWNTAQIQIRHNLIRHPSAPE